MQTAPEVSYHDVTRSQWIDDYINDRVARLEHMADDIVSCRVVIERAQHHSRTGNPYRVRVEATVPPKKELVADKSGTVGDPHVQLRPIIRKAFEALEKQLHKQDQKRRGAVKHHEEPRAIVSRVFPEEGYGFIQGLDGEDYYFHRNSVLHDDFDRLMPGTEVRFEPEMGEEGPQASTVQLVSQAPGPLAAH